jgi:hypothetical protein
MQCISVDSKHLRERGEMKRVSTKAKNKREEQGIKTAAVARAGTWGK